MLNNNKILIILFLLKCIICIGNKRTDDSTNISYSRNVCINLSLNPFGLQNFLGESSRYIKAGNSWNYEINIRLNKFSLSYLSSSSEGVIIKDFPNQIGWIKGSNFFWSDHRLGIGYTFPKVKKTEISLLGYYSVMTYSEREIPSQYIINCQVSQGC